MNSPGKILKVWLRLVKKHEEGKDVKTLPKKGQEQKLKIKKGLTGLKTKAVAAATPAGGPPFLQARDRAAVVLRKYCRYLKAAKDEDKKLLPKHLKMVKQITVLVENLNVAGLDLSEDDAPLESLDTVDTTALDAKLEQPDTDHEVEEEEVENEAEEETPPAPSAQAPPTPPPPPPTDTPAATFEKRRKALEVSLLQALKERRGDVSKMRATFQFAQEKAAANDYPKALASLDTLEKLLQEATAPPQPGADGAAGGKPAALNAWKAARTDAINQLRKLEAAVVKLQIPESTAAVIGLESIIKNLTESPATPQSVQELERYLSDDDAITAAEEVPPGIGTLTIRAPLLQALKGLK